jgi:cold shock CspA family protein
MTGTITSWKRDSAWGFVRDTHGRSLFLHAQDIERGRPYQGAHVEWTMERPAAGRRKPTILAAVIAPARQVETVATL